VVASKRSQSGPKWRVISFNVVPVVFPTRVLRLCNIETNCNNLGVVDIWEKHQSIGLLTAKSGLNRSVFSRCGGFSLLEAGFNPANLKCQQNLIHEGVHTTAANKAKLLV